MAISNRLHWPPASSRLARHLELLLAYLGPRRRPAALLALLLLGSIGLRLLSPQFVRQFIDAAQSGSSQPSLALAALAFLVVSLVGHAAALGGSLVGEGLAWQATNALRADLALHVLRLDMPFHGRHTPGELIERVDGDVANLANFLSRFTVLVLGNALLVVGIIVLLLREDWWIGLGLGAYALVAFATLGAIQGLATARWRASREASADLFGFVEERVAGLEDIRANGAEAHVSRRLGELTRSLLGKSRAADLLSNVTFLSTSFLSTVGYAVGLGAGAYLYTQGAISIGTAYMVVFYVGMLSEPLESIRRQVQDLARATASIERVEEIRLEAPRVRENGRAQLPEGGLAVELRDVRFSYDGRDSALRGISFRLEPSRVLGLLGRTGSGKTTLTRLLFRLYDADAGGVFLGGVDLREVGLAELRRRVGMVTQDVQVFQASVRDNLTLFARGVSDARLERALDELGLGDWVRSMPAGLDTRLGAGGLGLSAGEAQLLAFTRVFLRDPDLVILDEASSRLDPATERLLERAIDRLLAGRTGLVIAHRLHTVQRADELMILEAGEVVERGPREALARDPNSRFHRLLRVGIEEALA